MTASSPSPHELTVKSFSSKKKMVLLLVRTATFNKEWLEGVLQLWGPQLTISCDILWQIFCTLRHLKVQYTSLLGQSCSQKIEVWFPTSLPQAKANLEEKIEKGTPKVNCLCLFQR